jgi:multiple sugar transport system permease protein
VTAPQIWDVLGVAVLVMAIWTFNTFDMVYLMARGNPAANVLSIEIWRRFYGSFNFSLAAATAVLMFVILFGLGVAYVRRCRL